MAKVFSVHIYQYLCVTDSCDTRKQTDTVNYSSAKMINIHAEKYTCESA